MKRILSILVSISLLCNPLTVRAEEPSNTEIGIPLFPDLSGSLNGDDAAGTEDGTGPPFPGNEVPIDSGLSLLLAAGAAYGARRLGRRKLG